MRSLLISILILSFIFYFGTSRAQITAYELSKIQEQISSLDTAFNKRKVNYLFSGKSALMKYNPVSLFFGASMYFYQKAVSPQLFAQCVYHPSCSNFSSQSIRTFGLLKGIGLSADRLSRCNQSTYYEVPLFRVGNDGRINDPIEIYAMPKIDAK
jgi:putative component of membrane protein insertase Oxa1/YidC/SpoIIIJ protein YidD